jgi:hypothetical protein
MFDLLVDFFNQPPLAQDYVLYLLTGFLWHERRPSHHRRKENLASFLLEKLQ